MAPSFKDDVALHFFDDRTSWDGPLAAMARGIETLTADAFPGYEAAVIADAIQGHHVLVAREEVQDRCVAVISARFLPHPTQTVLYINVNFVARDRQRGVFGVWVSAQLLRMLVQRELLAYEQLLRTYFATKSFNPVIYSIMRSFLAVFPDEHGGPVPDDVREVLSFLVDHFGIRTPEPFVMRGFLRDSGIDIARLYRDNQATNPDVNRLFDRTLNSDAGDYFLMIARLDPTNAERMRRINLFFGDLRVEERAR